MLGILKIRSAIGAKPDMKKTLSILKLDKKFTLTVVQDTKDMRGMVQKIKDYVTWGELSKEQFEALVANVKPTGDKIKVFRMHPPKGGFKKTIKKHHPKGELGYRKDMGELLMRMLPLNVKQIEKPDSTRYKVRIVKKSKPAKKSEKKTVKKAKPAEKPEKKAESVSKPKKPAKPAAKPKKPVAKKAEKKPAKKKPAAKKPAKKKA